MSETPPPSAENSSKSITDTSPSTVVELYNQARRDEIAVATQKSEQYRLSKFLQWCEDEGIESTTELRGRRLYEFRIALQNGSYGDLSRYTILGLMSTVRAFVGFAERIDAANGGLSDKILLPKVDSDEMSRDTFVESEFAKTILEDLSRFHYASRDHVMIGLMWHVGCRIGGLRSLDVDDFDSESDTLVFHHRPNEDTPLKNKRDGERPVALSSGISEVVEDYIQHNRIDATDDEEREPLFSTTHGRMSLSQMRRVMNYRSHPCLYGPCPHGRDPDDCNWHIYHESEQCPSSHSSHDYRRGRITDLKSKKLPSEVISDRTNASPAIIEEHYDERTDDQKKELRRQYLEDVEW